MPIRLTRSTCRQILIRQSDEMYKELEAEMTAIGQVAVKNFEFVVKDWDDKPQFAFTQRISPNQIYLSIVPFGKNAKIFIWVDQGTREHIIRPRGAGYPLRFQTGYNAKTAPIAQYGVGDGSYSGDWRASYEVVHPGTEAREFTREFLLFINSQMQRRVENALRRGIRRANNSL